MWREEMSGCGLREGGEWMGGVCGDDNRARVCYLLTLGIIII